MQPRHHEDRKARNGRPVLQQYPLVIGMPSVGRPIAADSRERAASRVLSVDIFQTARMLSPKSHRRPALKALKAERRILRQL